MLFGSRRFETIHGALRRESESSLDPVRNQGRFQVSNRRLGTPPLFSLRPCWLRISSTGQHATLPFGQTWRGKSRARVFIDDLFDCFSECHLSTLLWRRSKDTLGALFSFVTRGARPALGIFFFMSYEAYAPSPKQSRPAFCAMDCRRCGGTMTSPG